MKSGRYYVGDLCYVMEAQWDEVMHLIVDKKSNNLKSGEFELSNGVRFAIYETAWGDGIFEDQEGRSYGVDSGTIGCILVDEINDSDADLDSGNIIDFHSDFKCNYSEGVISIGKIKIDTDPDDEEDEQ